MTSTVRLLVADDHPLFRQGVLRTLALEPDFEIVAEATDGKTALELIRQLTPDVALLDVNMPELNGMLLTHKIVSEKLPTRVVLLTGYDDASQVLHAAVAGAWGFCSKDIEPERLITAVQAVAAGNYVMGEQIMPPPDFRRWLKARIEGARTYYTDEGTPYKPLSNREMQVLECIVRGMSNKEIALELSISQQTVKNHITSILRKFGVEDRTQAVVYALKHGWVDLQNLEV